MTQKRSNAVSIAVVSKDKDFERACAPYTELLYFPSLPAFTEAILSGDRRVSQAKKAIDTDRTAIVEKIREQFPWRGFYHGEDYQADIEDIEVDDVVITNVRIIHIGGTELTMAFDATVHYSAYVRADDHSTAVVDSSEDFYMVWQEYRGTVQDQAEISAVAKCSVGHDWRTVKEVVMLEIQEDDICVEALPEQRFSIGEESRD